MAAAAAAPNSPRTVQRKVDGPWGGGIILVKAAPPDAGTVLLGPGHGIWWTLAQVECSRWGPDRGEGCVYRHWPLALKVSKKPEMQVTQSKIYWQSAGMGATGLQERRTFFFSTCDLFFNHPLGTWLHISLPAFALISHDQVQLSHSESSIPWKCCLLKQD